jgi:predicted PurR-regulated permease PerM
MSHPDELENRNFKRIIESIIRIAVLVFILGWCFLILSPFLSPILWGLIIAVTEYPLYMWLRKKFKGRSKLSAALITFAFLALLVIPTWMLADSLLEGVRYVKSSYQSGQLTISPPDEDQLKSWPAFTKPLVDAWRMTAENMQAAAVKFAPQLKEASKWILSALAGIGMGILQFVLSILVAGVFLVYSEEGGGVLTSIFIRLAGDQGSHLAKVSETTIRNVVKGILGVAIAQTLLAAIGFVVAGVPLAGLWALLCLILAIVQVGVGPVVIGVAIYMFATADTLTASLFAVWTVIVTLSDNVLKPILLGKGAPVPMLVIFLGSVGGFIASGFIGLFLGAVILTLGYKLFQMWLNNAAPEATQPLEEPPAAM